MRLEFTGTGNSCDDGENSGGNIDVDTAKIVRTGVANLDFSGGGAMAALDPRPVGHVTSGESIGIEQVRNGSLEADLTAPATGPRPQVHHMVGDPDRLGFVFNDEHGVSLVSQ